MPFTTDLRHLLHHAKLEAMGGAQGNTGGLQPFIQPVHAIIAFDHFSRLRIPLGGSPWAGADARLASDAQPLINKYNAVFLSLLHGARGTSRYTPGIFAMKAGHENVGGTGDAADIFRPDLDNLAQPRPNGQVFIAFTGDFARSAGDTFFGVLK